MNRFDSGVKSYIFAQATVRVSFPVDWHDNATVCCELCPYYRRNYRSCGLNSEICEYPSKYIGSHCPLDFLEKENENDEKD